MVREATTRRGLLKLVGATSLGLCVMGEGAAAPTETIRLNVGYSNRRGDYAVRAAAEEIIHDYPWNAYTIRAKPDAFDRLAAHDDIRYVERDKERHVHEETLSGEGAHDNGDDLGDGKAFVDTDTEPEP